MRRVIFINRFFFPDHSATSQILSDLAFHLAATGREVHVITGSQVYDDPRASLPAHEIIRGVCVHRVASTRFGRVGLFGRAVDYGSFYLSAWHGLAGLARRDDIVVAETDPPLISVVAMTAVGRRGSRLVNWLQDVYPEVAVELGIPFVRGPVAAALAGLRNRSLRHAEATVVVGDLMKQRIQSFGIPAARIQTIPNWCDDEDIRPVAREHNPLREAWGLENKFVIGYSGNLGRAHEIGTVLSAAEQLRGDPRMLFLMIGGGKLLDELARTVTARRIESLFRFVPYQDKTALKYSLTLPDIHWISLRPELEGLIVPSKFYGIAAAGKPMIIIGAAEGELGRLVRRHACGVVIAPGDGAALAATLSRLSRDAAALADMGARAREMLETQFARATAFERWQELLDSLDRLP
jgi:glycosyltransferase involved in cell wall biosynthesis